jgi:hypothetical protein
MASSLNADNGVVSGSAGLKSSADSSGVLELQTNGVARASIDSTGVNSVRLNPRVSSSASASSLTPDISAYDQYCYTALAAGLTINAPTGTPLDGNKLLFRILDNGVSRTLTWNATYTVIGVTLPTSTTVSKMTYVGCVYNAANTRWDVVAVTTQA